MSIEQVPALIRRLYALVLELEEAFPGYEARFFDWEERKAYVRSVEADYIVV